jgi:glutathione S-transferase
VKFYPYITGFVSSHWRSSAILRWSSRVKIDLSKWTNITAFMDRVEKRPKVQEALKAEGLIQ